MEQTLNKSKPWMLPFWFLLGIMLFSFIENILLFAVFLHEPLFSRPILMAAMLWPSILLVEVIIYYFIRRRIANRKFVWLHLLFSLFAFILLWGLYAIVLFTFFSNITAERYEYYFRLIQKIQGYVFWISVLIGHIFFVITIVFSFSKKEVFDPEADGDFLSELPD
jgi:hypothetical protein